MTEPRRKRARTLALIIISSSLLSACESTAAVVIGAASIATFVQTDKAVTDHAASYFTGQDCSILYAVNDEEYCQDEDARAAEELAAREAAEAQRAQIYCYRTLGKISCYREPDPLASGYARVQ